MALYVVWVGGNNRRYLGSHLGGLHGRLSLARRTFTSGVKVGRGAVTRCRVNEAAPDSTVVFSVYERFKIGRG